MSRTATSHRRRALYSGFVALATVALLAAGGVASAAPHGGFHGGGMTHGSFARGGFAHGGFAHGGFGRGGYGHGGFARGGYGYRYGPGWRGYGWGPYWGWGLGLGLYLSALPWDYATYWWDGVPYYYTGDDYYVWDGNAARYEPVQPPPQVTQQAANAPPPHLYAYPKNGQSAQQQARDQTQCRSWASQQAGAPAGARGPGSEYLRAEAACLQGRGYSVD